MKVEISEPAALDIERVDGWWRGNRDRKDLFRDELFEALAHIEETPELATLYETDEIDSPVRYGYAERGNSSSRWCRGRSSVGFMAPTGYSNRPEMRGSAPAHP